MVARDTRTEADLLLLGDGSEVIVQLEARFNREAVHAGCVGQQVKLQGVATFPRRRAQETMGNNDRGFAAGFDNVFDRFRIPRAQMLDDSISVLVYVLRHSFSFTRYRLFVPVQRALFPEIEVTNQQDGDVYHHFDKTIQSQLAKHVGPRIQKNRFHIEQNENHRDQVKLYREGFTGVACGLHATLIGLQLGLAGAPPADQLGKASDKAGKYGGNQQL